MSWDIRSALRSDHHAVNTPLVREDVAQPEEDNGAAPQEPDHDNVLPTSAPTRLAGSITAMAIGERARDWREGRRLRPWELQHQG